MLQNLRLVTNDGIDIGNVLPLFYLLYSLHPSFRVEPNKSPETVFCFLYRHTLTQFTQVTEEETNSLGGTDQPIITNNYKVITLVL